LEKLRQSAITAEQAIALDIVGLTEKQTASLHESFKPLEALRFNYYDLDGRPLSQPGIPHFYRLRYLNIPLRPGTDKPIVHKYTQLPDSAPAAYFPRNVDWKLLASDWRTPVTITEGELKAASASLHGMPTIGLGGVSAYSSKRLALTFLPELEAFTWARRIVYICFDSDFNTKPEVCKALRKLAELLCDRGARPFVLPLPHLGGDGNPDKTGLDDYIVQVGPQAVDDLIIQHAQPMTLAKTLWELNDKLAYVEDPGIIIKLENGQKLSPSQFKEHAYANVRHAEQVLKDDGTMDIRPTPAAEAWLKWPLRHQVRRITYKPGLPQLHDLEYNAWRGWGVQPRAGNVKPFLQLIDHLFTGAEPAAKRWFLDWCAYPLQHPGTKLFSSAVIHGRVHGTGKSLIGYTLGRIYGDNFAEINQSDLHASFNEWAENKQFVLGDDVTGSDKRADADMLKKLITQQSIRINAKYMPTYVVPDCINYLFTTNQPDAFFLEDTDRRFFIHEVVVPPLPEEFYVEFNMWLQAGGASYVFDWLLKHDCSEFNPAGTAIRTAAKDRMTEDVRSDLASWVRRLIHNPDTVLKVGNVPIKKDLFTNAELLALYDPDGRGRVTANGLGRELRRAGVSQIFDGSPIKTTAGVDRYYAVRNYQRWINATRQEAIDHIEAREPDKSTKSRAKYRRP
jgi:hypothetical protein